MKWLMLVMVLRFGTRGNWGQENPAIALAQFGPFDTQAQCQVAASEFKKLLHETIATMVCVEAAH